MSSWGLKRKSSDRSNASTNHNRGQPLMGEDESGGIPSAPPISSRANAVALSKPFRSPLQRASSSTDRSAPDAFAMANILSDLTMGSQDKILGPPRLRKANDKNSKAPNRSKPPLPPSQSHATTAQTNTITADSDGFFSYFFITGPKGVFVSNGPSHAQDTTAPPVSSLPATPTSYDHASAQQERPNAAVVADIEFASSALFTGGTSNSIPQAPLMASQIDTANAVPFEEQQPTCKTFVESKPAPKSSAWHWFSMPEPLAPPALEMQASENERRETPQVGTQQPQAVSTWRWLSSAEQAANPDAQSSAIASHSSDVNAAVSVDAPSLTGLHSTTSDVSTPRTETASLFSSKTEKIKNGGGALSAEFSSTRLNLPPKPKKEKPSTGWWSSSSSIKASASEADTNIASNLASDHYEKSQVPPISGWYSLMGGGNIREEAKDRDSTSSTGTMTQQMLESMEAAQKKGGASEANNGGGLHDSNNASLGRDCNDVDDEIQTKIPAEDGFCWSACSRIGACLCSVWVVYPLIFTLAAVGLVYGTGQRLGYDSSYNGFQKIDWEQDLSIAFIGSAYLFVNDIPRVMESLSTGHIRQNSCLHPGGSIAAILATGNGMYKAWRTQDALVNGTNSTYLEDYGVNATLFDYGVCTVAQLLQGYDEYIGYRNPTGSYYDDGLNPCIMDPYYANYVAGYLSKDVPQWDFVVLADQTKRMAIVEAREETMEAMITGLAPFIEMSGAIPVFVDTHAFWSKSSNMTGLNDVPTFTALIYDGLGEYLEGMASQLPEDQAPIVAPIGLAYLTIWEEDYDLWQKLFLDDQMHSSIYGSYLFAVVLYATVFGHLPNRDVAINNRSPNLFLDSRRLMGQISYESYPSTDETEYMCNVARRVVINEYVPKSLESLIGSRRLHYDTRRRSQTLDVS